MKILQINKFYYLKGGAERYMFELSKILEGAGHQVVPFAMRSENNIESKYSNYFLDPVCVDSFSIKNIFKIFYNYDAIRKLKKAIKEEKPELAHLHNIYYQISPAIIKVLKKNNIKVVMTLHDYFLVCPNYNLYTGGRICLSCVKGSVWNVVRKKCIKGSYFKSLLAWAEFKYNHQYKKYYDLVDMFIAPSQYMKDICVQYGIDENKIKVINNFVDPVDRGEDVEKKYLLYFGRVSKEKGISLLLEAYAKTNKEYNLHIVGEGEYLDHIKKTIKEHELEDRVSLLGYREGEALENEIRWAKAIVIPSVWPENMPYVLLESMARSKVVIATQVGGMAEIIKDSENGFLFPLGDTAALGAKIDGISGHDLDKIKKNAKNSIKAIDSKNHLEKILDLYKKLID